MIASPVRGACIHMAVAAFQPCLGVGTVRKGILHFFMTVRAQIGDRVCPGCLRVWVVAGLALDICLAMRAGLPLIL